MKWFTKMNLPNKLTVIRMLAVILIIIIALLPYQALNINVVSFIFLGTTFSLTRILIFVLFAFASFTDFLDGNIARKRGIVTTFGKFLDPIADKLLVNVLFIILTVWGEIPIIVTLIFIIRDTIVDAIRLIAIDKQVVIAASKLGKLKTVTQMISLIFVLLFIPGKLIVVYLAGIISLISGIEYFIKNRKIVLEGANYNG
ncbi:MAG: CDP-diacylglycerol--glycerol-3-phosphate 3-phosphatidyltransferase [Erysipelotrichales bacterium]|nr:CDP-diacylglycerol--glycerol-3-phosphate 3-phosphatidyltransferase [Erysipelotrichales bacterium]